MQRNCHQRDHRYTTFTQNTHDFFMYFFLGTEYKTLPFFHLPLITYSESFIYLMSLSVVQCESQKILSSFFLYLPYKNIHNHTLRQHKQESDSHEQEREGGERKKEKRRDKREKGKENGKGMMIR